MQDQKYDFITTTPACSPHATVSLTITLKIDSCAKLKHYTGILSGTVALYKKSATALNSGAFSCSLKIIISHSYSQV